MRSPRSYADLLEDDLRWLGLFWDEGGSSGGPDGPYYQSERTALYQAALARLEEQGLVYPCFCSRAQLHAAQAPHLSDGRVLYPGTCRDLTAQEVAQRRRQRPPALRLRVPDETVSFVDRHLGPYSENLQQECGDFLIRRSDGVFAYQLAVVVDDAAMGVTQVVRGGGSALLHPAAALPLPAIGAALPHLCPHPPPHRAGRAAPLQAGRGPGPGGHPPPAARSRTAAGTGGTGARTGPCPPLFLGQDPPRGPVAACGAVGAAGIETGAIKRDKKREAKWPLSFCLQSILQIGSPSRQSQSGCQRPCRPPQKQDGWWSLHRSC